VTLHHLRKARTFERFERNLADELGAVPERASALLAERIRRGAEL
jgi:hypothetical protein